MSLGSNILKARKDAEMTQEKLADAVGVSFQAVSAWERDEYLPDTENLIRLAEVLEVSLTRLVEDKAADFETTDALFDWSHMKTFVKTTAKARGMENTLKALPFAEMAHEGAVRKHSNIPYIYHPLNLACHALAMGLEEDELIAACLLHDVVEDTDYTLEDLPVNDETKKLVALMTKPKVAEDQKAAMLKEYFAGLASDPRAALLKCLDRCNNLTTMSWGMGRNKIFEYIEETEVYILPLLKVVKADPRYNNAAWLLKYQICSMLDIYKRLL
ncbi:MAG: helix-turn-helix domain-containing protein [Erysipelotrichaceae bacterium]|nr:helix-turn-helix domain-containing protein [Erysipelotrichaceae bacterium]